eukprot:COSAG02_NODE_4132_length_5739_cov_4.062057_2_plen_143_part_00
MHLFWKANKACVRAALSHTIPSSFNILGDRVLFESSLTRLNACVLNRLSMHSHLHMEHYCARRSRSRESCIGMLFADLAALCIHRCGIGDPVVHETHETSAQGLVGTRETSGSWNRSTAIHVEKMLKRGGSSTHPESEFFVT